jgi:hypothetical protein
MEKTIRGDLTEVSMDELKKLLPKKKLQIFVSSTFLDTNLERDILHRKILPYLQKRAQQHDIQVTFYDMRFGVRDENTLDHLTWESCKDAIRQCHEGSDGLFFLSLQADRYGYLPLPKYLNEDIMLKVCQDNERNANFLEMKKLLLEWYILDENQKPRRYELKALSSFDDSDFWQTALPTLRDTCLNLVPFEKLQNIKEELRINHSVTEWETLFALNCDKERCYWLQRSCGNDGLQTFSPNSNSLDISVQSSTLRNLEELKKKMKIYLKEEQRFELFSRMSQGDYFQKDSSQIYFSAWEQVIRGLLDKELDKVIDKLKYWHTSKSVIPIDYLEETIHHNFMALGKARNFYGREDLIEVVLKMTISRSSLKTTSEVTLKKEKISTEIASSLKEPAGNFPRNKFFAGIDLALIGKSGCGKTSLMANSLCPLLV